MNEEVKLEGFNEERLNMLSGNSEEYIHELSHLPKNIADAINQLIETNKISKKIKDGYYKENFFLIAALPKAGSSSLAAAVASILGAYDETSAPWPQRNAHYMSNNVDCDLRPEMLLGFPEKVILKHHPRASGKNLKCLDLLGCRYLIGVRHPADQLTALYCHYRDPSSGGNYDPEKNLAYDHISPFKVKYLWRPEDMENFFSHLINDGYLETLCKWMVDWLHFRNRERSYVIRYEDFFNGTGSAIADVYKFVHKNSVSVDELEEHANNVAIQLNEHLNDIGKRKTENKQRYPHGFTGDIGVYRNYFSDKNLGEYNNVIDAILSSQSMKQGLDEIYSDLRAPV
ncbi:MAG: sulfotransferase domain-containing protein [Rhodospirillales bacterium]|nr:sulfotransferase domain-containing protein [Rhodospirillales bacterium]